MSESITSAPPSGAPASTPSGAEGASAPPASGLGPGISVSDAARMLAQQRRQPQAGASSGALNVSAPNTPVSASNVSAPNVPVAPAPTDAAASIREALGLGPPLAEVPQSAPAQPAAGMPGMEIGGRYYDAEAIRRGFMAQADYTTKTQELAQQRRAVEQQQQALATVLPYIQPEIEAVRQRLEGVGRPDPALIETNPQEFLRQRDRWEASQLEQQRLAGLTQMQSEAAQRVFQQRVEDGHRALVAEFKEWGDEATRTAWQTRLAEWGEANGYSRAEMRQLVDPRQVKLMMKAMVLDSMQAGTLTRSPATPTAFAPRGAPPPAAPAAAVQRASDAFEARPDWRTGAALLAARRGAR